ncbi:MAG: hypothetical protein ACM31L_15585 [Actinomycetota bacterium]
MDKYEVFSRMDCEADRTRGKTDGGNGQPPTNTDRPVGHVLSVINEVRADLTVSDEEWQREVARQMALLDERNREVKAYDRQKEILGKNRDIDRRLLRSEGDETGLSPWGKAKQELAAAAAARKAAADKVGGRSIQSRLSPFWYFLVMVGLAVLEFPINYQATRIIFLEDVELMAIIVAAVVGILLVSFAHSSGRLLKQRQVLNLEPRPSVVIWVAVGVMSLAAIGVVFYLRWRLITEQRGQSELGELLFFLFLNLSVYFIGLLTAILHYDPSAEYQTAHYAHARAHARFRREEARVEKAERAIASNFAADLKTLRHRYDRLSAEVGELMAVINRLRQQRIAYVDNVAAALVMRLSAYAEGNREGRGGDPPAWLSDQRIEDIRRRLAEEFHGKLPKCEGVLEPCA